MESALGISIGTRSVGIAILYRSQLRDCRVKNFPGKWDAAKLKRILDHLEEILDDFYKITAIAFKAPLPALCSENVIQMSNAIQKLGECKNIPVMTCTLQDFKVQYGSLIRRSNKEVFISALVMKYPELMGYVVNKRKRHRYYEKLFEAIVCAEIAQETRL